MYKWLWESFYPRLAVQSGVNRVNSRMHFPQLKTACVSGYKVPPAFSTVIQGVRTFLDDLCLPKRQALLGSLGPYAPLLRQVTCAVRWEPRDSALAFSVCMLASCRTGPATGIQTVEMCGDKSPLIETVSLMSRIKNANDGLNCGIIKPLKQLPQTGPPMPCLWFWVLFMSRQLVGGSFLPWACHVGDPLHHLPPSQGSAGPNEGGFEVP